MECGCKRHDGQKWPVIRLTRRNDKWFADRIHYPADCGRDMEILDPETLELRAS